LDVTCPLPGRRKHLAMREHLAKLQGHRFVAAREVLELVGVAEELQPSVVLPNTRRKNYWGEGA